MFRIKAVEAPVAPTPVSMPTQGREFRKVAQ